MAGLRDWWRARTASGVRAQFDPADWSRAWQALPLLRSLSPGEAERLAQLALLFLRGKALESAQGLQLTDEMRLRIAFLACLPVLQLGLDWYDDWYAVIVYPDAFIPEHEVMGEDGVVWIDSAVKAGESWERGPVILSWADIEQDVLLDGQNLILHEMAHKLDGRSGSTNGCPPLHRGMSGAAWKRVFSRVYDDLCRRVDRGEDTLIDPYATESPPELFAVVTEVFFETPAHLVAEYPDVYALLKAFYKQDPLTRLGHPSSPGVTAAS